jgi:hypothetical protein
MTTVIVADSAVTLLTDDGVDVVRGTAALTVTLPKASENKGRCICFINQDAAETMTIAQFASGENIDGADASFTALDAEDDWVELYCTGSEWIIIKKNIA